MPNDWSSCDGRGWASTSDSLQTGPNMTSGESQERGLSRRQAVLGAALGGLAWASAPRTSLAQLAVRPNRAESEADLLVYVFLRGGMDGLNAVIPCAEDDYHRSRPALRLASPKDRGAAQADRAIDLDGFFGLHPALASLHPIFEQGRLGFVHAVGSGDQTRSHFEAMATVERGQPNDLTGSAVGWLARHLALSPTENGSPLRAVALSSMMPDSLRGATGASAITNLSEFRLDVPRVAGISSERSLRDTLANLYGHGTDAIAHAGRETLKVIDSLARVDPAQYRPQNGAAYPASELGGALKQVACLIHANVGLEVACLDRGGWDTHFAQGSAGGLLASQLADVGDCLAAFDRDMAARMKRISVVVMTEFGRRLHENSALGTDHGRGSVMMLMGGGVRGGKVHGAWPGLMPDKLDGPGDLRVTTDYRDVLSELLAKRLGNNKASEVFPAHLPRSIGAFA